MSFILSGFSDEIDSDIKIQFEHLTKLGMKYFEPRGINGTNIADLSDEQTEKLKKCMDKYKIKVSSIGSPIGKIQITDSFDEHILKLKRVIEIAKKLEAKYIRVFSFYIPDGESPEKYRDEVIYRMKAMTKIAEEANIILLHENEKGIYGDIAIRCKEILDCVNSKNLWAVFDPANFIQCGQITYPDAFEIMKPYIKYMHIKDAKRDGTVVPVGFGEGMVEEILHNLKDMGYQGFLSLEPHLGTFNGLEGLEESEKMMFLEKSTAEKFTLAHNSLINILDRI